MLFGNQQSILHDQQIVRVFLPLRCGETLPFEGVVKQVLTSHVEILFPAESFPAAELDPKGEMLIVWEKGDNVLSARARFDPRLEGSRVKLEITGFFFQSNARRYPRVYAEVYLKYWPIVRQEQQIPLAVRQKINISGCGIRFQSKECYATGEQLGLEISLPGLTLDVVSCIGCVVWTRPGDGQNCEVAVDIVQIDRLDLDKILNFCIVEQFKQLNTRVRSMGPMLSPGIKKHSHEGD